MFKVAAIVSALAACASATLETVELAHPSGSFAEVTLFGAQVVSFYPAMDPTRNVFFLSSEAVMDGVEPISGGVGVLFPNYGNAGDLPYDGFAHTSNWTLVSQQNSSDNNSPSVATFTLTPNDEIRKVWHCDFVLEYTVKLHASTLEMGFSVLNKHTETVGIEALLFNSLLVDSVLDGGVEIRNLTNTQYLDIEANANKTETRGSIVITERIENLYIDTPDKLDIVIHGVVTPAASETSAQHPDNTARTGKAADRTVTISKYGSISGSSYMFTPTDIAVWNPWIERANVIPGFSSEEYKYMVAVGPGHVSELVSLQPDETFTLYQNVTVNYHQLAVV